MNLTICRPCNVLNQAISEERKKLNRTGKGQMPMECNLSSFLFKVTIFVSCIVSFLTVSLMNGTKGGEMLLFLDLKLAY